MALVFGLTGGIASGKSTVSTIFRENGVYVVDADEVARHVVQPGSAGLREVVETFGAGLLPDGNLDRKALGAMVFEHPELRMKLDEILGPHIMREIDDRIQKAPSGAPVCLDAALIVEKGMHVRFRPLVVVAVSPDVQLARIQSRDSLAPDAALARIRSQLPIAAKIAVADHVIWNDEGLDSLRVKALVVLNRLLS